MSSSKKHIAIIIPGGIGTGRDNLGVPILEQIVKLLALQFEVTVFQLHKTNSSYRPVNFKIIDFPSGSWMWWSLLLTFKKLNRHHQFTAVHGFWAMPCGFFAVVLGKLFGIPSLI